MDHFVCQDLNKWKYNDPWFQTPIMCFNDYIQNILMLKLIQLYICYNKTFSTGTDVQIMAILAKSSGRKKNSKSRYPFFYNACKINHSKEENNISFTSHFKETGGSS